jgi:hypothetical protein
MNVITLGITADLKDGRRIVLTVPPEVPIGSVEITVTIGGLSAESAEPPCSSLADWAEQNAEDWGDQISSDDVEGLTGRRY